MSKESPSTSKSEARQKSEVATVAQIARIASKLIKRAHVANTYSSGDGYHDTGSEVSSTTSENDVSMTTMVPKEENSGHGSKMKSLSIDNHIDTGLDIVHTEFSDRPSKTRLSKETITQKDGVRHRQNIRVAAEDFSRLTTTDVTQEVIPTEPGSSLFEDTPVEIDKNITTVRQNAADILSEARSHVADKESNRSAHT